MLNIISFTRRDELLDALVAAGITGPAAVAIAAETAAARHAHRMGQVRAAAFAARAASPDADEPDASAERDAWSVALCLLDAMGVGGRGGVEGSATLRLPAFRSLGKGRHRATDGAAWDAAIECAWRTIAQEVIDLSNNDNGLPPTVLFSPHPRGLKVTIYSKSSPLEAPFGTAEAVMSTDNVDIRPWLMTAAREGLRRAIGLGAWFKFDYHVEFDADASGWAELVNLLTCASDDGGTGGAHVSTIEDRCRVRGEGVAFDRVRESFKL